MTQEYIEPTSQSQVGLTLVGLAAVCVAFVLYHFGPTFFEPPSTHSVCEALAHYRGMMQKGSLILIVPGLWLCYYASRILISGQSPAPGAWVLHRAAIKTGPQAARAGYFIFVLGILVAISPTYFWSDFSHFHKGNVDLVCTGN